MYFIILYSYSGGQLFSACSYLFFGLHLLDQKPVTKTPRAALEQDINLLFAWSKKWQLKFNSSKCNWLHLGKPHGFGEYVIGGTTIAGIL